MNFDLIERAGISQREFSILAGVSRVTVNKWVRGGTVHSWKAQEISELLSKVATALDVGALPLQDPSENVAMPAGRVRRDLLKALSIAVP
jgi:transcriptional regulator with XRE-family HTH domain